MKVSHTRSKSAPSARPLRDSDSDTLSEADNLRTNGNNREEDENGDAVDNNSGSQETIRYNNLHHGSSDSVVNEPFYDLPEGEDYMAIYETIDRKRQEVREMALIHYLVHYLLHYLIHYSLHYLRTITITLLSTSFCFLPYVQLVHY